MAYDFPSSPNLGQQYLGGVNLYLYDNTSSWTTIGNTQSGINPYTNSFKYRTIYTRGYVSAGYKDGSPWQNVNRTVHSTDITTNLGNILDYPASYKTGGFSDYYHYVYGTGASHSGYYSNVSSINMQTETGRSHDSSWDLKTARYDAEAMMNSTLTVAYIVGGASTNTDKHNLVTEVMYAAGSAPAFFSGGGTNYGVGVFFGQYYGWGSVSSTSYFISWSTEIWSSANNLSWATDGQPKGLSSKHGWGYGSIGTYSGSSTLYKFNDVNGGSAVSSFGRPESCGEENTQIGQNWGYTLGSYNGAAQTNNSTKVYYTTDSCVNMGSDTMPKGHDGMSSGCCGTASSQVLGGY